MLDLAREAVAVLNTADAGKKAVAARRLAAAWRDGNAQFVSPGETPKRPARGPFPELRRPGDMPKRKAGGALEKRVALLHALAHIELNAIDLAWDLMARFGSADLPREFFDDWVRVGDEEALHFTLLSERLRELGAAYGDLPAHDGLWQAAEETAHDLLARLAIVPLVLEARGLDVTPATLVDLRRAGDEPSAAVLEIIYRDEIGHVAIGKRWFDFFAAKAGQDPATLWQELVRRHFRGRLKPPFNRAARDEAGFSAAFYEPLANS
jgi:uncharacterized ferritin-like protein (DUF455 family)